MKDPLGEDDGATLVRFTDAAGTGIELVADDHIRTSAGRTGDAASIGACNTALIKPNQAGTLSETYAALEAGRAAGWQAIFAARSR